MASIEVLAGPERRRRWSIEQKQAIVGAAFEPGAVVRDVARRVDVTSSLKSGIERQRIVDRGRCRERYLALNDATQPIGPASPFGNTRQTLSRERDREFESAFLQHGVWCELAEAMPVQTVRMSAPPARRSTHRFCA
jgi:hypothetical protein